MRYLIAIILFTSVIFGFAQESNKKKILVIPCSRFEFISEFELEEIAEKNEITSKEVFLTYQKAMLNTFESYSDENFEFVKAKHDLLKPYKKFIKYESGKFKGRRYNTANLKGFKEADFTKLLEAHGADFVVFITWYDIQKESYTAKDRNSKRVDYAGHYIDYDVFNLFKQRVVGEGSVKAKAKQPTEEEASFSLLRVKELTGAYNNFIDHIIEQLNKPIE